MLQARHAQPDFASTASLVGLAAHARALGRTKQADRFLLLAWAAFDDADLPAVGCAYQLAQAAQQIGHLQALGPGGEGTGTAVNWPLHIPPGKLGQRHG
jgi:hypothetical protein